jgi:hypothetical protein
MGYPVKGDSARRSYILITGRVKRVWVVKFISEKVKEIIRGSEACRGCKCEFPIDSLDEDTFFWYVVINGKSQEEIEACDEHIFGEIFKELENLGIKHRITRLAYPPSHLKIVGISEEEEE